MVAQAGVEILSNREAGLGCFDIIIQQKAGILIHDARE